MYIVYSHYSDTAFKRELHETYEEALEEAEKQAGKDYEDMIFTVAKVEVVLKADRPTYPVKKVEIKELLIENKED